jgi:multidrug efflux pump subunit AcrB
VDIRTATAQVTSVSQTVLKQMPPGITPPLILNYNASTVPILQWRCRQGPVRTEDLRSGAELHPPVAGIGAGRGDPSPYGGRERQIQIDLDPRRWSRATFPPPTSAWRWRRRTRSCPPGPPRSASTNTTSG